jgi:hypothetical protein
LMGVGKRGDCGSEFAELRDAYSPLFACDELHLCRSIHRTQTADLSAPFFVACSRSHWMWSRTRSPSRSQTIHHGSPSSDSPNAKRFGGIGAECNLEPLVRDCARGKNEYSRNSRMRSSDGTTPPPYPPEGGGRPPTGFSLRDGPNFLVVMVHRVVPAKLATGKFDCFVLAGKRSHGLLATRAHDAPCSRH